MSITFPGFCGPSYQLSNHWATIERSVNWMPVSNESRTDTAKGTSFLEPSPGNAPFGPLPVPAGLQGPCRGLLEYRGLGFGVNGPNVFKFTSRGAMTRLGDILDDNQPVSMVANANGQIGIASAGKLFVIQLPAGNVIPVVDPNFLGASFLTFQDGYLIALTPNSNQFQISGTDAIPLGDMTQWDAANISIQAGQADLLAALLSSREYLRLLGTRRSQIYQNVGSQGIGGFPFQSYNETFIETGIGAPMSLVDMGESMIWVGEDARGQRACWRDVAFQPQRISDYGVEWQWQRYQKISDAVAFPFIWQGHLLYQITFPSAFIPNGPQSATWIYDQTESNLRGRACWHERQFLLPGNQLGGRPEHFHAFVGGVHVVGSSGSDGNPGALYQYSPTNYGDCAQVNGVQVTQPVVRDRICPVLWHNDNRLVINRLRMQFNKGMGLDGGVLGSMPEIMVRVSRDGGATYGPELHVSAGQIGEYGLITYLNRLGYSRQFVIWVRCSDPVLWSVVNAELDIVELPG